MTTARRGTPAPFVKWAGGKSALAPALVADLPPDADAYHEPFLGGGAVFFAVRAARPCLPAILNDANRDLIECFEVVRDRPGELLDRLSAQEAAYLACDPEGRAGYYYEQRATRPPDPVTRAARFIFLNRTGYNGLYRVNSRGQFNVPHGRYRRPRIADRDRILSASLALTAVSLTADDFEAACARAEPGDFVYLDPPYRPLSTTSHFTAYTSGSFDEEDQARLAAAFHTLTSRGVRAVLSNSDHPSVVALYEGCGYRISRVLMARSINSKPAGRSPIPELLVDNRPALVRPAPPHTVITSTGGCARCPKEPR